MQEQHVKALESKLDELIKLCDTLNEENKSLKASEAFLISERAKLIEKNEEARSKVEAMITRLKALEQPE